VRAARTIEIFVDGRPVITEADVTVAAALLNAGIFGFRTSVSGQPRGPLCAMGVCFECRVVIDGVAHRRSCMESCVPGMRIQTRG
jgi:D-hydroxyproline dehydrogenase subunit gamma